MATVQVTGEHQTHPPNGSSAIEHLTAQLRALETECATLRTALATSNLECDRWRAAYYDEARAAREFEDLDIETLKAMTAGPVEMIE